jgi:hypothetical protein
MKPVILFRKSYDLEAEMQSAQKYFEVVESRVGLANRLVIPRYSLLPFPHELERDIKLQGGKLINSTLEHQYIANFDYYHDVALWTPRSYFDLQQVPKDGGPFVIKGRTNSRKHQWLSKMYATDYKDLLQKYWALNDDPLIQDQGIVIRDFVKLKNFGTGINGLDFANEWRFFFYKKTLLSYGYYWSSGETIPDKSSLDPACIAKANEIAETVSENVNFFVLDLAQTEKGDWILIEINDGSMSGLSENDPEELYKNLAEALKKDGNE